MRWSAAGRDGHVPHTRVESIALFESSPAGKKESYRWASRSKGVLVRSDAGGRRRSLVRLHRVTHDLDASSRGASVFGPGAHRRRRSLTTESAGGDGGGDYPVPGPMPVDVALERA